MRAPQFYAYLIHQGSAADEFTRVPKPVDYRTGGKSTVGTNEKWPMARDPDRFEAEADLIGATQSRRGSQRPQAAKTRRLLPAASCDTIQVPGFMIYGCLWRVGNILGRSCLMSSCSSNASAV